MQPQLCCPAVMLACAAPHCDVQDLHDIEDLKGHCSKKKVCPYFTARDLALMAGRHCLPPGDMSRHTRAAVATTLNVPSLCPLKFLSQMLDAGG